jgi:hypothetical protein
MLVVVLEEALTLPNPLPRTKSLTNALAVEYEQIADGNTEAYFTLLTLAEGAVLLNGVKALVAILA